MKISRDRPAGTLNLSQKLYIEKVLSRFRVNDAKPRTTPLANHFKLSKEQSPKKAKEHEHMALIPYASAVGSLMYAMVCTRPDIAPVVELVSRYMANPGEKSFGSCEVASERYIQYFTLFWQRQGDSTGFCGC